MSPDSTDDLSSSEGDFAESFDLADGRHLEVRRTTTKDASLIWAFYEEMTALDRRRRFFGAFRPDLDWCRGWADVGSRGGFGVIAIVRDEGNDAVEVAGEAGYALRSDGDGDLAVTVAQQWRGWLGAYLVDVLVRHAPIDGIENLQADVLLENGPMLATLQNRGPVALDHDDGVVRLSIGTAATPTWPKHDQRRRVLVEIAGGRWSGERQANEAGLATAVCSGPTRLGRRGCPVLNGEHCPLADDADAIMVLLDPDDEQTALMIESHLRMSPGVPVLARRARDRSEGEALDDRDAGMPDGCVEVESPPAHAVQQILSLVGKREPDASPQVYA